MLNYLKNLLFADKKVQIEQQDQLNNIELEQKNTFEAVDTPTDALNYRQQQLPTLSKTVISAKKFNISANDFGANITFVLNQLHQAGYESYVVGGSIRDLILGLTPKDFDVATAATPEQVKKVFANKCRLIGKRFRLAHIVFKHEVIEVSTFRAEHLGIANEKQSKTNQEGMLLRDNVYGNLQQDVMRRDFTANALYYDIRKNEIYDFVNSIQDIQQYKLSLIGDPSLRYKEDPVRILRAIYLMAKLDMFLDEKSKAPIIEYANLLAEIPAARLFNESIKLLQTGYGEKSYQLLYKYNLLQYLFPLLVKNFTVQHDSNLERIIQHVLRSTDERIKDNLPVNPSFLFAAFYWYLLCEKMAVYINEAGLSAYDANNLAIKDMLDELYQTLAVPKRYSSTVREIWGLQNLLYKRSNEKQILRCFEHRKFRAGFDLLAIRAEIEGGDLVDVVCWWHEYQQGNEQQRQDLMRTYLANRKKAPYYKHKHKTKFKKKPI